MVILYKHYELAKSMSLTMQKVFDQFRETLHTNCLTTGTQQEIPQNWTFVLKTWNIYQCSTWHTWQQELSLWSKGLNDLASVKSTLLWKALSFGKDLFQALKMYGVIIKNVISTMPKFKTLREKKKKKKSWFWSG